MTEKAGGNTEEKTKGMKGTENTRENSGRECSEETVREAKTQYMTQEKSQGEYTLEDYYQIPDGYMAELIDGVIYNMAAPSPLHQLIGGRIFKTFSDYIDRKEGMCIPAYAPLDVQLDCDDKTMLQPDVLIVCDRKKIRKGVIYGAPDLVVEILSGSTKRKDMTVKLAKYAAAGVREYWMVDPDKKKVIVYEMEDDLNVSIFGFDHEIPVRIFGGECMVDFKEIWEYVSFLETKCRRGD